MTAKLKPPGLWTEGEDSLVKRDVRLNRDLMETAAKLNRPLISVQRRAEILKRMAGNR